MGDCLYMLCNWIAVKMHIFSCYHFKHSPMYYLMTWCTSFILISAHASITAHQCDFQFENMRYYWQGHLSAIYQPLQNSFFLKKKTNKQNVANWRLKVSEIQVSGWHHDFVYHQFRICDNFSWLIFIDYFSPKW